MAKPTRNLHDIEKTCNIVNDSWFPTIEGVEYDSYSRNELELRLVLDTNILLCEILRELKNK